MAAGIVTVTFDASQRAVIAAGPDERLLVVAGAGRGKTEVIAGRIQQLVDEHGLQPSDEVLVLTFSRAAVAAARRRLEDRGNGLVAVSTFDSFATRVLLEAGEDPSLAGGFDQRVRAATKALREDPPERITELRHVLLDEVQDLVGDRAEFALALLGRLDPDCGFTALGDPLQAIYDWQLDESTSKTSSYGLLERLTTDLGARRTSLDVDYRARGKDPLAVVALGDEVRRLEDGPEARELVAKVSSTLLDLGPMTEATNLVDREPRTTAVLCRTNGQALVVSQELRNAGVRHVLRRQLVQVGVAAWVGTALGDVNSPNLDKDEVLELVAAATQDIDPTEAWVALKEAERRPRDRELLTLSAVRQALRVGAAPLGLAASDHASVVVSTVHRAKGLEFDRVIIVPARERGGVDADPATEMRVSYVALSRARDEVYLSSAPAEAGLVFKPRGVDRWAQHAWQGRRPPRVVSLEALSVDVDVQKPTRGPSGTAVEVQAQLRESAIAGAPVVGLLESGGEIAAPRFTLHLQDGGAVIGRTSESLGRALARVIRPGYGRDWPRALVGLAVGSVETVAGDPDLTRFAGLPGSGLWLVPRLTGLARPDWKNEWEGWT